MGPFDRWPTGGGGFEYFYGFIGGETNQWYPALYEGTTPVEPPKTPEEGYHLTEDMTDQAIDWVRQQKALMPDKPFFIYFAPGATHAPHHVPKEWADKYKGQFDQGWDALREETLRAAEGARRHPAGRRADGAPRGDPGLGRHARRAQAGAGAPDGGLRGLPRAHRPPRRPADRRARATSASSTTRWSTSSSATTARPPRARCRALQRDDQLQRRGRARDAGVPDRAASTSSARPTPTTTTRSAGRTRWTRPTSGPSRSPRTGAARATARSCTGRTASRRRARSAHQFRHVIDVAPTILEAAGLPEPTMVNGVQQSADRGHQHALHASTTPTAPERHDLQYFEMFGNRGIYHQGWSGGDQAPHPLADRRRRRPPSTTTSGSSTTAARTGRRRTTSPRRCPTSCTSCSGCG